MGKVLTNGPGDRGSIPSRVIIKYVSRVSGTIQGMEYRPPLHLGVVAIEKGAFGSPSTKVANFTFTYIYIYIVGWVSIPASSVLRV